MSRAQRWMTAAAIAAAGSAPASAHAAPGAQATVRDYVAAVHARDARRVCSLLPDETYGTPRRCRSVVRSDLAVDRPASLRVEGVLVRGARARAVVDVVTTDGRHRHAAISRARLLLGRVDGRWRVVVGGTLPPASVFAPVGADGDPQPVAAAQALRRLADDELLAVSGNADMLCGLLAPGAPLGGRRGACATSLFSSAIDDGGRALRLARYAEHRLGPRRARLDVTIAAQRAVATRTHPGYAVRTTRWRDTLHAVRTGGRWRLVKPSRAFYLVAGQPLPSDVTSPAPTATWPLDDAGLPSLTETPMPAACRVPPALWGAHRCGVIDALAGAPRADGGGVVAWTTGFSTRTRAVAAGGAAGPAVAPFGAARRPDELWNVVEHGLVPVSGGALLVQQNEVDRAVRVLPLDDAGRPRGPARVLDRGVENPDDGDDPVVVTGPPEAGIAAVVLDDGRVARLTPEAAATGPAVRLGPMGYYAALAILPDGTLLTAEHSNGGVGVRRLGADGRPVGPLVVQPHEDGATISDRAPDVAVDSGGHVLVVWQEARGPRRVDLRGWVYDASAPLSAGPFTIAQVAPAPDPAPDPLLEDRPLDLQVGTLPGGGWSLAYAAPKPTAGPELWTLRLDAAGTPEGAPRPVAERLGSPEYGLSAFTLAGDTVAWIAAPRIAGVVQVRSAALP